MRRRAFFESLGRVGIGSMAVAAVPGAAGLPVVRSLTTDRKNRSGPTPSPDVVSLCRQILEQNLLERGETFILATPFLYDPGYVAAMMTAAGDIGGLGMHVTPLAPPPDPGDQRDYGDPRPGITDLHWQLYAQADLFITCAVGTPDGIPAPTTGYSAKVGNHPYRTDFEFISRPGSKTRWLTISEPVPFQRRWFPTEALRQRTRDGAKILEEAREIRVTSKAGSDWVCSAETRPGHAQYGIADHPGRWDNFTFGCAACGPLEDSAQGVVVLEPGDMIAWPPRFLDIYPPVIDETIKVTFRDGYIRDIEGGRIARMFERKMASYDDPEVYGTSHFGWGTHTRTGLGTATPVEVLHHHHNTIGSLMFGLGINYGHGLGVDYSGLGETTRVAREHPHFTLFNATCFVDGQKVIEDGKLLT